MTIDNRRHNYVMKDFFIPIMTGVITASIVAVGISWGQGIRYGEQIKNIGTDIARIEKKIEKDSLLIEAVQANQIILARRGEWMDGIEARVRVIEDSQIIIKEELISRTQNRFNSEDAKELRKELIDLINQQKKE